MTRILASLAGIAALFLVGTAQAAPPSAADALKDRILGDPDAPIEIIEYASLTCSHCRDFHLEVLPDLKENYIDTGKVKLIYRDFPFDQQGLMASVLARCAPPNRYFQFLDVLFRNQDKWTQDPDPFGALMRIGKLGGLSGEDFKACLEDKELVDGMLQTRLTANQQFDVKSTPTFLIGDNNRIVGNQPYEVFDDLLKKLSD
ncbi:MAG: DsbA family protein [Alphaproteobacteria bacterium]